MGACHSPQQGVGPWIWPAGSFQTVPEAHARIPLLPGPGSECAETCTARNSPSVKVHPHSHTKFHIFKDTR